MPSKTIRFPDDLAVRVQAEADRTDRSFSYVVLRALESALNGQGSGDTSSVSSPWGSGSVKETAPTEPSASSRAPGDPAAVKAKREAPPDRRVKGSTEARPFRPVPKAGKR